MSGLPEEAVAFNVDDQFRGAVFEFGCDLGSGGEVERTLLVLRSFVHLPRGIALAVLFDDGAGGFDSAGGMDVHGERSGLTNGGTGSGNVNRRLGARGEKKR